MRRLLIRPGAIGDCILSLPALEYLKADYTELWISSAIVPLVRFVDRVRPISSTGIDLLGVGDIEMSSELRETLLSFDSIVSWYGSKRPDFRDAMLSINPNCEFHSALPCDLSLHATDFFAAQVGAPSGLIPSIRVENAEPRNAIAIHPFSGSKAKNWPLRRYH